MPVTRFSETEMLAHCGRALTKIDTRGRRGTETVTHDEIEAMAALLVSVGAVSACKAAMTAIDTAVQNRLRALEAAKPRRTDA